MIIWSEVKKVLHKWAAEISEQTTIWEDQSEQRPDGPYCSLKIISGPGRIGTDQFEKGEGDTFSVSGLREFTLSVNIFRVDAFDKAHYLNSSIEEPMILARFQDAGIAYINATPVRDLSRLMGPRYESRGQFDVRFRIADTIESDPGMIETVELEDDLSNIDFTVP